MPGELPNIVAGRVANIFSLRGPNFITDAACASSFAAMSAAVELLVQGHADAVLTGGVDRNMVCSVEALVMSGALKFFRGVTYYAVVRTAGQGSFNAQVVDVAGNVYITLANYRTVTRPL